MDFVDLDKVLDQFEEEEKAAEEILPGQEVKPSGYADYLVSHQDKPWEMLSFGQPVDTNIKQLNLQPHSVVYDDPYESCDKSLDQSQVDLKQLGYSSTNNIVDYHQNQDSIGQELIQAKLKEQKIETYLSQTQLSNGVDQVLGPAVNGGLKWGDGEKRGLIASQPASIQTDILSPASERELLSYPLPKSDILVEGHDQDPNSHVLTNQDSTQCKTVGVDNSTTCPSSNSASVGEHTSQKSSEDIHLDVAKTVSASNMSEDVTTVVEKDTANVNDGIDGSFENNGASEVESPGTDRLAGDQEVTDSSLKQNVEVPERVAGEETVTNEAVGFKVDECEMDKEEMDAYLQELETSMCPDSDVVSSQAEAPFVSAELADAWDDGDEGIEQDMVSSSVTDATITDSDDTSDSARVQMNDVASNLEDGRPNTNNSQAIGTEVGEAVGSNGESNNAALSRDDTDNISRDNSETTSGNNSELDCRDKLEAMSGINSDAASGINRETISEDVNEAVSKNNSEAIIRDNSMAIGMDLSETISGDNNDAVRSDTSEVRNSHETISGDDSKAINLDVSKEVSTENSEVTSLKKDEADNNAENKAMNVGEGCVNKLADGMIPGHNNVGINRDTKDNIGDDFVSNASNVKHPDVVSDISGNLGRPVVMNIHSGCDMDTDEKKMAVADMNVKLDKPADKLPTGPSECNKSDTDANTSKHRLLPSPTSLEFPVAGNKNELSSVVKGKLEIEGLLDEIVAARLAQKSSESLTSEPILPMQPSPEQTMCRDSEKTRTQGWGPEGSMVCVAMRETSSASPEVLSPGSGSPSPTLGIGARPKDPSQMKKNRPNSLLGLSKISLGHPFSPPQQANGAASEMMMPVSHHPAGLSDGGEKDRESRTHLHGIGVRHLGALPLTVNAPSADHNATMPVDSALVPSATETLTGEDMESPFMRRPDMRGDAGLMREGVEASALRPQSWSPGLSPPPAQKTKRPTSLNLPVRQDRMGSLSPDGDSVRSRRAEVLQESDLANGAGSSEEEKMGMGGTDSYSYDEMHSADQAHEEGAAAAAEFPLDAPPPSILHLNLGKIAPTWLPDADALSCMECAARFTFTKRRHHCRACGKIFCSTCCGQKSRLTYLENKEGRVCVSCFHILSSAECVSPAGVSCRSPNPNNPIEYCSTVPPTQQANARAPLPTVMVPTGVLKRHGSNRKSEPKQVMFSDGIRPGGDLTELDGSDQARIPPRRTSRAQKKVEKQQGDHSSAKTRRLRGSDGMRNPCLIPDEGLPPVVVHTDEKGEVSLSKNPDPASLMEQIKNEEASPVVFAINLNLFVQVKIINLDCCVNRVVWCFTTQGMVTAGQEELVVVLETLPDEDTIPRDIFSHFSTVYEEAGKGNTVSNMGHSIFNQPFLESSSQGGFLYIRSTFQCTNKLMLPPPPFLFAILLQKWETPWAKVFPIRLMLRLGAEHRYYPCPLVSIRNRKPVFYEIGHTIMNLLADFRNFQYMLQQIRGVRIHMGDKKTFINFPRNRYDDVMKVVSSSNEHVMALGASFSTEADSHLVCIQNEDGNYQTQAINIQNKPRQVTGASFVVFNGALKSSSGLRAKSSIVEDGVMVQIMPEMMAALKQSMKDMTDFTISCGSVTTPQPEEVVTLRWVDDDKNVNVGVKSPVDGMSLEGVESVPVHNATDYVGERFAIRWTQVFFLQTESGSSRWEPVDLSRVAETLATAVCIALTPHLHKLKEAGLTKIGLRVTLQPDSVGYEVGSNGERLPDFYMNDLDNALIPVIHGAISSNQDGPIVMELILHLIH